MEAVYIFKLDTSNFGESEVSVQASSYKEAKESAEALIKGSKSKLGSLHRVVDFRLTISHTNVVERKLIIDEHNIKHTGEVTEYKVKGEKKN